MRIPLTALLLLTAPLAAQVPNLIPHQGRVAVNGVNFDGTGQFKFALVNAAGSVTYWSNDSSSTAGSQPTAAVSLPVTKGLYSALLGDTSLANMTAVPASVFTNADLRLRVWFNNGALGFQQLTPDQRLAPNGYLPDGAVTSGKLAAGATIPSVLVTGTSRNVVPNTNYIATGSGTTTFTLPSTAAIGDTVTIGGSGTGSLTIVNPDEWTPAGPRLGNWRSIATSADGTKLIAADAGGPSVPALFISTDSGQTWTDRGPQPPAGEYWRWGVVASSANGTYLAAASPGASQIYVSGDAGLTWTARDQSRFWRALAMSADGSRLIAAEGNGRLYTSSDFGLTWVPREQVRGWYSVACSADGMKLIASTDNAGLHTSADGGVTWTSRGQTGRFFTGVASSADGTRLVACEAALAGRLYISTDSGVTWEARGPEVNWASVCSSADGLKLAAAPGSGQVYLSTDGGATWVPRAQVQSWGKLACTSDGSRHFAVSPNASGFLYFSRGTHSAAGTETASFTYGSSGWSLQSSVGLWTPAGDDIHRQNGRVSIGTTTPQGKLTVFADTSGPAIYGFTSLSGGAAIYGDNYSDNGTGVLGWAHGTGTGVLGIGASGGWAGDFSGNVRIAGKLGILTDNPATALHVNGVITGDGSGLTNLSAARLTGPVPVASLTSLPAASITGTLPVAALPADVARRAGGNAFTGNQTIAGRAGIGTANPAALLQLGDANISNSVAMMRFGSSSPSRSAWREWEIGVPGGTEDTNGKNYSFIIDDLLGGNGEPEVTVRLGTGFVGIGTAYPTARLDVDTVGAGRVQIRNEGNFVPGINVTGGPLPGYLRFRHAFEIWPNDAGTAPGRMDIRNAAGAPTITMDGGAGSIGIGRTAAANRLEVEGDASKSTAGSWLANSDRRIKTDIRPVTGALETLKKVNPVTFRYTEDYRRAHPGIADVAYYNVIAQEFREVFPDAVKDSGEKLPDGSSILQVDTHPAAITALAAIKELKQEKDAEIAALRQEKDAEIARLREETKSLREALAKQNASLEARLAAMERSLSRPVTTNAKLK
jgi:hypothetical protein